MATTEAIHDSHDAHGDDHGHDHDHLPFLAHHFDTPEQQFDSGKLGIWLFLVTEILFFSGLFVAYALFRMLRPEVFVGCSEFLSTKLGAINTGVLLFSSMTMAWAVRCAQLEQYKRLTGMLAATLSCAMIFLGIKAIEYSHKWDIGLLPPRWYFYHPDNPHPEGISPYLVYLSIPFAIGLVGLIVWNVMSLVRGNQFAVAVSKPMIVVFACYFVGVGVGTLIVSSESHHSHHDDHGHSHAVADADHAAEAAAIAGLPRLETEAVAQYLAADETNTGVRSDLAARQRQEGLAGRAVVRGDGATSGAISVIPHEVNTRTQAGAFFGIYYTITGIHAIHILCGIGVLTWLLVRSVRHDFNRMYFGPVDYVGLYWHVVDLIWIFVFPLLYLIR